MENLESTITNKCIPICKTINNSHTLCDFIISYFQRQTKNTHNHICHNRVREIVIKNIYVILILYLMSGKSSVW